MRHEPEALARSRFETGAVVVDHWARLHVTAWRSGVDSTHGQSHRQDPQVVEDREVALVQMGLTGYRSRVLRERPNVEFRPVDFESPTRLREGQPITIRSRVVADQKDRSQECGSQLRRFCVGRGALNDAVNADEMPHIRRSGTIAAILTSARWLCC